MRSGCPRRRRRLSRTSRCRRDGEQPPLGRRTRRRLQSRAPPSARSDHSFTRLSRKLSNGHRRLTPFVPSSPAPSRSTDFSLGEKYEGKVRDCYMPGDGRRIIVVSDRLSAFDAVVGTIPFKGQVLNQVAQYWFDESREIAKNHVLEVPDPNVMIGRECIPLKAEFIMRAYLTGRHLDVGVARLRAGGRGPFAGTRCPRGWPKTRRCLRLY